VEKAERKGRQREWEGNKTLAKIRRRGKESESEERKTGIEI